MISEQVRMHTAHAAALSVALIACVLDIRSRRIPNWLTFGAALAGVGFHVVLDGAGGAVAGIAGWGAGAAVLFVPFALGGMGAGDVKLLAALGAWLGPADALWLGLYTGIAGGVLALAVSIATGYLGQAVANVRLLLTHWQVVGLRELPKLTLETANGPKLAYGVSILVGTMVTVWAR